MFRRFSLLLAAVSLCLATVPASGLAAEPIPNDGIDPFGATPIAVNPDVVDPMPHAWDHVLVGPDGRSLMVYFWGGVEECYGLHSVMVEPTASGIDLRLAMGMQPDAANRSCIEIAVLYVTTVVLDEPLIGQSPG